MNISELKLTLFRQIDNLNEKQVEELYGWFQNYLNGQFSIEESELLTESQRKGLYSAIEELDSGGGTLNEKIFSKYREQYGQE